MGNREFPTLPQLHHEDAKDTKDREQRLNRLFVILVIFAAAKTSNRILTQEQVQEIVDELLDTRDLPEVAREN